jgi:hypothetical protein
MNLVTVEIIGILLDNLKKRDKKIQKLFYKQKEMMEKYYNYPSLGKTKLINVVDNKGNELWEIRLNKELRIVYLDKTKSDNKVIWLKICTHDEIKKNNVINIKRQ